MSATAVATAELETPLPPTKPAALLTDLAVMQKLNPLEIFTSEGTASILERICTEAKSYVLSVATKTGRKDIASLALKVAKSKTFLDDAGKELVSEWKEKSKVVDAQRKLVRDTLDALKEEVRKPLTEWEQREETRVNAHEVALLNFRNLGAWLSGPNYPQGIQPEMVQSRLDELDSIDDRDWEEFADRATELKATLTKDLTDLLASRKKHKAEQEELFDLRKEAAEAKQRERDEKLKTDAADKARKDEEERSRVREEATALQAKLAADAVQKQTEKNLKEAVDKAETDRLAFIALQEQTELDLKLAAVKAESDRLTAIARQEQAEKDLKQAADKAETDRIKAEQKAEADKLAAVQAERDRVEADRQKELEDTRKREADREHKATIHREILTALAQVGITDPDQAKAIIVAIAKGQIPNVKINY